METLHVFFLLLAAASSVYASGYAKETTFNHCSNNSDIVIVVDSSASISLTDWSKVKIFMIKLIEQLSGSGVYVGIVIYSDCAKVIREVEPIVSHYDLKTTILKMKHIQKLTNTHLGLQKCKELLVDSENHHPKRSGVAKYAILISDGMSNRDVCKTLVTAQELKALPTTIISVAVGEAVMPGKPGHDELVGISSNGDVITVKDYDSLSSNTIDTICKEFKITEGNPCPKNQKDIPTHCGVFRCSPSHGGYHWRRLYTGCPYNGKILEWDEEVNKPGDCNLYKCSRLHCGSHDNECGGFAIPAVKVGCEYGEECVMEGDHRNDDDTCTTLTCTRFNGQNGPYGKMVATKKRCRRDGQCHDYGHTYEKGCDSYRCTYAGYYAPCKRACSYNDECVDEKDTIEDDCDIKKCVFSAKNELLEMQLVKKRCNDGGKCYDIGEKWTKVDCKCVQYCCVEKNGEAVIDSEIIGCTKGGNKECTPVGGVVKKVKNSCVAYKCTSDGKFILVKAECRDEEGRCRHHNEKWRPRKGCWMNCCLVDKSKPHEVRTKIEKIPDCIIKGHCVLRGRTIKFGCTVFRCSAAGTVEIVSQDCHYKGRCIQVGNKPFVDRSVCKLISCQAPGGGNGPPIIIDVDYGCYEYGKCYDPDAKRQDRDSCIVRQCHGGKHRFFPILCSVDTHCIKPDEKYLDPEDCVCQLCKIRTYPPGAELLTKWTGCFYKGKCYKPGDTRGKCTIKICKGNNVWVTKKAACLTKDGKCQEIGTTWFDERDCRKYKCKSNDGGESAIIVVVLLGCTVKQDCIKSGVWIGKDTCAKYQCQNGVIKQLHIACDLPVGYGYPKCLDIGKSLRDPRKCVIYSCKKVSQDQSGIQVDLLEIPGCRADRCYFVGELKHLLCKTYRCNKPSRGLELYQINGCIDENGHCKAIGAEWEYEAKCVIRTCHKDGSISERPLGCIDSNDHDKCVRFNNQLNNNGARCQIHYCKLKNKTPIRYIKYTGCAYQERCIQFHQSVNDLEVCKTFTCVLKNGKPALEEKLYGCFSDIDGKCYKFGHLETEPDNKCTKYRCLRGKDSFVVERAECLGDDGRCYKQNKKWYAEHECVKFKCRRENIVDTYRVRMNNDDTEGCEGLDDNCLEPGDEVKANNCTEYVCDPDNGGLVIKRLRCQTDEGECKDLGDVWVGNNNCAKFKCVKIGPTRVKIVTKEIGCKADGKSQCYDDGKEVRKKCNIFKCNGDTNQMYPIKMGCWWNRKCYKINERWTDSNCITYKCILVKKGSNVVITDIEEVQGCKHKGKCYDEGATRSEGCNKKKCGGDGNWILTLFRCKAEDGSCFKPGETFKGSNCTTYGCNADSQSVYPIKYECLINNECVPIGKSWFNPKACKYYRCSFDPENNNAFREEIKMGCRDDGRCIEHGETQQEECTKTKCENGQMVIVQTGCEWHHGCKKVGESWNVGCIHHRCVIKQQTPTSVTTGVIIIHGCKDCYGKCHHPGAIVNRGCIKQKCLKGGKLVTIKIQCFDQSSKSCVDIGQIITVGGLKKKCTSHGSFKVIPKPTFCTNAHGGKLPIGQTYKDKQSCKTLKCVLNDYETDWIIIKRGCKHDDHCHDVGDEWFDNNGCYNNKCILDTDHGHTYARVLVLKACKTASGICYRVGQKWKTNCKEMECRRKGTTGAEIVVVKHGCQSESTHKCYSEGQTWTEKYGGDCHLYKCMRSGNAYVAKKIRKVCHDHYGNCKDVGDTYYECDVGGHTHYGCSCSVKDGHACSTYQKDYKQPSGYDLYGPDFGKIIGYGVGGSPPSGSYGPPPSGSYGPPPSGSYGPPPSGSYAPPPSGYGPNPSPPSSYGSKPPPRYPPPKGNYPPPKGSYPPPKGNYPPPKGNYPPEGY